MKERKKQQVSSITREREFQNSVPALTAFSLIPKFYTICSGQKGNLMNKGPTCSTVALSDLSLTRYLGEVKTKCYNLTYGLSTLTEQTVTFCIKDKMTALRSKAFSSYKTKGFSCRQRDGKEKKINKSPPLTSEPFTFMLFLNYAHAGEDPIYLYNLE